MPNRIIKESLCESEKIAKLTDFEFRVWVGLIVHADDAGRGDARPAIIKGRVFPLRERVTNKDIENAVCALAANSCVTLYKVDGRPYYWFQSWTEHQRIRDSKPRFPGPEEGEIISLAATCGESRRTAATCGESRLEYNTIQSNTNPNTNTTRARAKRKFGKYDNVLLSDSDLEKLKEEFPDWEQRIERLSEYMASSGKKYADHLATIRNWARKDGGCKAAGGKRELDADEASAIKALMEG